MLSHIPLSSTNVGSTNRLMPTLMDVSVVHWTQIANEAELVSLLKHTKYDGFCVK